MQAREVGWVEGRLETFGELQEVVQPGAPNVLRGGGCRSVDHVALHLVAEGVQDDKRKV